MRVGSLIRGLLFRNLHTGWNLREIHHVLENIVKKCNLRNLLGQNWTICFLIWFLIFFDWFLFCSYCLLCFPIFGYFSLFFRMFCYLHLFCDIWFFIVYLRIFLYFCLSLFIFSHLWLDALWLDSLFSHKILVVPLLVSGPRAHPRQSPRHERNPFIESLLVKVFFSGVLVCWSNLLAAGFEMIFWAKRVHPFFWSETEMVRAKLVLSCWLLAMIFSWRESFKPRLRKWTKNSQLATNPDNYVLYIIIYTSPHLQCRTNMCFFFHSSFVFTNGQATHRRLSFSRFPTVFFHRLRPIAVSSLHWHVPRCLASKRLGHTWVPRKKCVDLMLWNAVTVRPKHQWINFWWIFTVRFDGLMVWNAVTVGSSRLRPKHQWINFCVQQKFSRQKSHKGETHPALETLRSCKRV